ncbi:hypothetical protein ACFR9U_04520 [Halorientalis brevis]|uniref:DUF7979 domain-containing protein n=1 Tax=Halorientalis brevis TaxID=1126241 RepID=A0ABD6C9T7_9EURY|nr:hypothetical protein [Halorientalis brevis]
MERYVAPAVVLCLIGLAALGGAFVLSPDAGKVEYYHAVERVPNDSVPNDSTPRAYDELSPEARAVFQDALNAPDNEAIVTDAEQKPPEFDYIGDQEKVYSVRYNGSYYEIWTGKIGGGPLAVMWLALKGLLGVVGLVLLGIGSESLRAQRLRPPVVTLGILLGSAILVALNWVLDRMLGVLLPVWAWFFLIVLVVVVPIILTEGVDDQSSSNT